MSQRKSEEGFELRQIKMKKKVAAERLLHGDRMVVGLG